MATLELFHGNITTLALDAIVNAANPQMLGGGGVDGAIHRAAGPELLAACRAVPEVACNVRCPTGQARITPGFALPARYVIHTVGPVWHARADEPKLLAECYRNCLALAARHDLTSIAFPAISTGVYGFPKPQAAEIAVHEVTAFFQAKSSVTRVLLVAFSTEDQRCYERALENRPA